MAEVVVTTKGANRIRRGHLWIYRSDVIAVEAEGGDVVSVVDEVRNFVGMAFYSAASEISLRIFTTKKEAVDEGFWRRRISAAISRRDSLRATSDAYRLINSESDLIPSLIVDRYAETLVIQTLSQGTERLKNTFVEILKEVCSPTSVIERNDVRVREKENLELRASLIYGDLPNEMTIEHDGIRFLVEPLSGQKTGSFLDQRENHFAVRDHVWGRGLDCFTFNGGFALNMAKQCSEVLAVDISEEAVRISEINARLNNITNVRFRTANVFDELRELEKKGERFDSIVLDPPAFVKGRAALRSAARGYKEINLRAMKLLGEGGVLVTCSCSFHFSEEMFIQTIEDAARDAKKKVQLIEKRGQPLDHPVLLGMPESQYLKCLILRVID